MRSIKKTAPGRTRRKVEHARSYGWLRLADRHAGRRDGQHVLAQHAAAWVVRLDATWRENDRRQLAATADRLEPTVRQLHRAEREWSRLNLEITEAERAVAELAEPDLDVVGGGEAHLDPAAVKARRRREHAAVREALVANVTRLRAQRAQVREQCVALRAVLVEEFEVACVNSDRLLWFYRRRLGTYTRSLEGAGEHLAALNFEDYLQPAAWTSQPCPWLPARLDDTVTIGVDR